MLLRARPTVLGVTHARVSDLKRGNIDRFSMDLLVRLAAQAGLKPKPKLAAWWFRSIANVFFEARVIN